MSEDRVTYTFGRTIQVRQFEPIRFDVSYSTDCKPGESPAKALKRAIDFVEKAIEEKSDEFTGADGD
jgi:hypothetical protein